MIAAIVVFAAGIVLAVTQPRDLGGTASATQASAPATTPATTLAPASTSSSSTRSTPTTPTIAKASTTTELATSTTITPGGLGQSGAGRAEGSQHPATGGTSMLALGVLVIAAAFAVRRSLIA